MADEFDFRKEGQEIQRPHGKHRRAFRPISNEKFARKAAFDDFVSRMAQKSWGPTARRGNVVNPTLIGTNITQTIFKPLR